MKATISPGARRHILAEKTRTLCGKAINEAWKHTNKPSSAFMFVDDCPLCASERRGSVTRRKKENRMQAILRDKQDGTFVVSFHQNEGLPAHSRREFGTVTEALAAFSDLDWQDPDDDADGDVVKVAQARSN